MHPASNLIDISSKSDELFIDMVYATSNNVIHQTIYDKPICKLHKTAATQFQRAIELIQPLGLKFKIWDAWRPLEAQKILFNKASNPLYVSHPETGVRPHCRGVALDLTLTDKFGHELEMGTDFDDFRPLAHHGNSQISEKAQKNRLLLAGIMSIAGFKPFQNEWWHYQLPNAKKYPIITETEAQSGIIQKPQL